MNFFHFLQFTVGKPDLITFGSFTKQRSHEFFDFFLIEKSINNFWNFNGCTQQLRRAD